MRLTVNGLDQHVRYDRHGIEDMLAPLLQRWISTTQDGGRHYAFLAAPPGAGKSTIALLLQRHYGGALQGLGIDGFHYPQAVLDTTLIRNDDGVAVPLAVYKGAPETFDVAAMDQLISRSLTEDVRWPRYDRQVHDVVADSVNVTANHILLEGNWLLLDEDPWRRLRRHAEISIFIQAPPALLRSRLISRKVAGGMSRSDAESFYLRSDGPNVDRALAHSGLHSIDLL